MPKKVTYPVDKARIQECFDKRGLKQSDVSHEIGYERGYITNSILEGRFTKTAAILLEKLYNIKPEDYKPDEVEEEVVEATVEAENAPEGGENVPALDCVVLRETVAQAIIDSVTVLIQSKHVRTELQQMLYSAIRGALLQIDQEKAAVDKLMGRKN